MGNSSRVFLFRLLLVVLCFVAGQAASQEGYNTEDLNSTLKEIQRARLALENIPAQDRPELHYIIGTESAKLASQLTRNVAENGAGTKGLIDIILQRAQGINVNIVWRQDIQRYNYDGDAFRKYLQLAPDGPMAGESEYKLMEESFFLSSKELSGLRSGIEQKEKYLTKYPAGDRRSQVRIMLAIEYRDLARLYRENGNTAGINRLIELALEEIQLILEDDPGSRAALTAKNLQGRISDEFQDVTAATL